MLGLGLRLGLAVTDPQWQTTPDHAMGSDNRVRRITHRMGSQLLGEKYRWTVVPGRENPTYQLFGAESGFLSTENIHAKPAAFSSNPPDGQHHSDCLPESHGRHPLSTTFGTSSRNMGVVYTEENYNPCGTPPRGGEYQGSLALTPLRGLERLEVEQECVPGTGEQGWPFLHRLVRLQNKCTTGSLLQLETRP